MAIREEPIRIFISHRPGDSSSRVERLIESLNENVKSKLLIYTDSSSVGEGKDARTRIRSAVERCDVMILAVDRQFFDARDEAGVLRLIRDDDSIAMEIKSAQRLGKPVLPLLIEDAPWTAAKAPKWIRPLISESAYRVSDANWAEDVSALTEDINVRFGLDYEPGSAAVPILLGLATALVWIAAPLATFRVGSLFAQLKVYAARPEIVGAVILPDATGMTAVTGLGLDLTAQVFPALLGLYVVCAVVQRNGFALVFSCLAALHLIYLWVAFFGLGTPGIGLVALAAITLACVVSARVRVGRERDLAIRLSAAAAPAGSAAAAA